MLVLTIVGSRLLGLWLIATQCGNTLVYGLGWFGVIPLRVDRKRAILNLVSVPLLGGLILVSFAVPISRLLASRAAHDLPPPSSVSAKTSVQIGAFLIGLWSIGVSLPKIIASAAVYPSIDMPRDALASLVLGVLLVFGSGLLAGLVGLQRSWP